MTKKIIVRVVGRLGNQMYRYCFARILQEEVKGELFLDFF